MWRFTEHAFVACRASVARAERELLELENCTPGNFSVGKRIGCLIDLVDAESAR